MQTDIFKIQILDHHWIKGDKDDPKDYCSHGIVFLQMGDEIICRKDDGDFATSAASLHLLRTLNHDYMPGSYAGQLLPCCGHFIIPSEDLLTADVYGCPIGIDWEVKHLENAIVNLISENATSVFIDFEIYKSQVLAFADAVKSFYENSSPKVLPDDDYDRNGYTSFWNEWNSLRNKWT